MSAMSKTQERALIEGRAVAEPARRIAAPDVVADGWGEDEDVGFAEEFL